jgi:hypothetical protein
MLKETTVLITDVVSEAAVPLVGELNDYHSLPPYFYFRIL